jgi:hypothetical protein
MRNVIYNTIRDSSEIHLVTLIDKTAWELLLNIQCSHILLYIIKVYGHSPMDSSIPMQIKHDLRILGKNFQDPGRFLIETTNTDNGKQTHSFIIPAVTKKCHQVVT